MNDDDVKRIQKGEYKEINTSKLSDYSILCNKPLCDSVDFYDTKYDLSLSGFLFT